MKIALQKVITRKVHKEQTISEWCQPKGYKLSVCTLQTEAMKLTLNLVFGEFEEFKRFIKNTYEQDIKHNSANAFCMQFEHEKTTWNFMLITQNDWTAQDYGTIAHELHHFTHFALTEKGVSYGEGGEEVFAYTQGYFMELVVRAFVELRKALKTNRKKK
jgi:hypothetical protein